ncbi:alanine--tRNA ligase/DNA-binding transcriptional repressor [Desulfovibrionales bacterium]
MLTTQDIRNQFLEYFRIRGHEVVASSSLVPREDPSLLFTNAGMVQFKKVFLGQVQPVYTRAASFQKCLRVGGKHNDLENVGRTTRHHTFFEMLGNFSFGDYFKAEAIDFAWQFLTRELALPKDQLYATIYRDDNEADVLWQKVAGMPTERIYRLGEKDNFWSTGDTGPCGPCSEIIFDQGEIMRCGPDCGIGSCDCDRFLEIWNLVFMQYDQTEPGRYESLPKPSIDTGMGLERITAICQGVHSNFDIDLFQEIIAHIADAAGIKYHTNVDSDTALRVIADHGRAIAFFITDGILPSNQGRGYVLRRLIRRAFCFGRLIGLMDPFLYKTTLEVADRMGSVFPELLNNRDFISRVVVEEEERFSQTLDKGLAVLEEELEVMINLGAQVVSGEFAFKLYDTYGFPIDIINDIAGKQGCRVDEAGYKACMYEQKKRARAAWKGSGDADFSSRFVVLLKEGVQSRFTGYEILKVQSRILRLLDVDGLLAERLCQGDTGWLVAEATPFYGKSGGQVGDVGQIVTLTGTAEVVDVLQLTTKLAVHKVIVKEGEIFFDQKASMAVAEASRLATARNHTATHLLHAALRRVLGIHTKQAGSLVGPDRLRFDFTHSTALTQKELETVEQAVNEISMADIIVGVSSMTYNAAMARGAMALFGERYIDEVRVVEISDISVELCGGTHLRATGQIGAFIIISENSVAARVRRIEAVTGWNALAVLNQQRQELAAIGQELKVQTGGRPMELASRVAGLVREYKTLQKVLERNEAKAASGIGSNLMGWEDAVAGIRFLTARVDAINIKALRNLMDDVRSKILSGVACLAAEAEGKAFLILYVSQDLHSRFTALTLVKEIATKVGGSGGGRPDLAQAGGTNPAGIDAAFVQLRELVSQADQASPVYSDIIRPHN